MAYVYPKIAVQFYIHVSNVLHFLLNNTDTLGHKLLYVRLNFFQVIELAS